MADMEDLFGSDADSDNERKVSDSGSDSEPENAGSLSNPSGSESERDEEDEHTAVKPSNKELFGDDSEDEGGSQHSGSDIRSEISDHRSETLAHTDQEENDQSDVEQHSGSETLHDEDNDEDGHRSDHSSHHSEADASERDAHSEDEKWTRADKSDQSDEEKMQNSDDELQHSDDEEHENRQSDDEVHERRRSDDEQQHSDGEEQAQRRSDDEEQELEQSDDEEHERRRSDDDEEHKRRRSDDEEHERRRSDDDDEEHERRRSEDEEHARRRSDDDDDDEHARRWSDDEKRQHSDDEGHQRHRSDDEHQHSDGEEQERKSESAKGSDSEEEIVRQRPKKIIASDSDMDSDVGGRKGRKDAADLFGDADDISSGSDGEGKPPTPGQPLDEDGMDNREEAAPETRIEVEIPKVNTDLGNDLYFVKLPNFLSVEPRPFDPQYYEDEFEDEEMLDEEGRTRLKLKVENTIRWRTRRDEEGNDVRESNARIVKWSDGSMSLHLGNEVFDVYKAPLQGDHNHLFIRQGTGLQGQAVFKTKLTFRPHSTDSATHRKMTLSLADRCSKTQKIRILPMAGRDPESQRTEMIKKEEERLKASIRRESQQRRVREKQHQRGLSANYLEPDRYDDEEEGEEAISLAAIKNRYKGGSAREERARIYSSDSDEGSDDDKAQRLLKAKKLNSDEEVRH
ncbi:hypothetical protein FKM82_004726 [Ascaphus truei]